MKNKKVLKYMAVAVMALMLQACSNVLFYPTRQHVITPDKVNVKYSDVNLTSQDGVKLHGWYMPAAAPARGSILFLHGNGENISSHLAMVYWLPAEGYDVYLIDYRGYGASQGEADLVGSMRDIQAMLDYVAGQTAPQKVIVMGHSLGASMGIYALSQSTYRQSMSGYISIGAFSDYGAVTRDVLDRWWLTWLFQWPLSLAMDNQFSPRRYIAELAPLPLALLHSDADEIIEPYHVDILYKAAKDPKTRQMLSGDHNHVMNDANNRRILLQYLERFLPVDDTPEMSNR